MTDLRLTEQGKPDLREIARFSRKTWGNPQARRYVVRLREFCKTLAENPGLGRPVRVRHMNLLRMEQGSHVVFYREMLTGIVVIRILHQRMLPEVQSFDED